MNRTTAAALIAAAIVGTTSGAFAATRGGDADPGSNPDGAAPGSRATAKATPSSGSNAPAPTSSPYEPPTAAPLLYAAPNAIHDGAKVIPFKGPHHIHQLARSADGYVVAEPTSSQEASFELWTIDAKGRTNDFASVIGIWDLNANGNRLVGTDSETGKVTVWDLANGNPVATWSGTTDATGRAGFAGDMVLVTQLGDDAAADLVRWSPDTGISKKIGIGYEELSLSGGGSYLAGASGPEGVPATDNTCLHLQSTWMSRKRVDWTTCDWRAYGDAAKFSPNGTRLLAVPKETDGFGPGQFGVLDASDGPGDLVARINAPARTLGAQWADDDHLFLYGANTDDPANTKGSWIQRCDLKGTCTKEVRSSQDLIVATVM